MPGPSNKKKKQAKKPQKPTTPAVDPQVMEHPATVHEPQSISSRSPNIDNPDQWCARAIVNFHDSTDEVSILQEFFEVAFLLGKMTAFQE